MMTQAASKLVWDSLSRDVVVLAWPEQSAERERLERLSVPRLWLVEPGAEPPIADTCLEDWLRLPADDADVRARLVSLTHRAAHHPQRPSVDEHGEFAYRDAIVYLSPSELQLARPLVEHFGTAVAEHELIHAADDEVSDQTLRVHVSRLRRRLAPLGLTVVSVRGYGYALRAEI